MKELALIEQIRRDFALRSKAVALGIGDDCAILRPPSGSEVLVTTDFTLEGRHFRRDLHPPESVGHRCLARGLSDLAAMSATPMAAFLSLALPADLVATSKGRAWITRFFKGLQALAGQHRITLAGGDTAQAPEDAILADIVLLGTAPTGKSLRRSGARPGDVLYVTGALGGAAAELSAMLDGRTTPARSVKTEGHPQLFPQPRIATGQALRRRKLATACIDVSDGLSTDLAHLCRASNLAAELDQSAIPVHPFARKLGPHAALNAALHGGEDYELLFAAPASIRMPRQLAGIPITRIGRFTRKQARQPLMTLIAPDGTRATLEPRGWEHFFQPLGRIYLPKSMRDSTKIIRSTLSPTVPGEPLHSGPVFAAPYHTPGEPSDAPYTYARSQNPTWTELEQAIAQMESGPGYRASALVFASGMAACTAVFGAILRPGDAVVLPSNAYFAARVLLQEYFSKMGIELRPAPTAGNAQADLLEGAKLLWLETPSNPTMEVCDIAALCEAAHRAGALVAVDNTTPTPMGQLPLALGADFSIASDTKSMTGHSDLLLGHVAVRDPELHAKIDQWRTLTGGVLGPMEAWLALRSIATLPLRLERSCENAQRIAEFLTTRKEVESVLYPGLPTHPGHAIAAKQMRYFGAVLSFVLHDRAAAEKFLANAKLLTEATSFGGITTTAERRARWGGDAIAEGFIRMSAGCEAIEDLIEDMAQALDSIR